MATAKEVSMSTPSSSTCRYDCPICLEPVRSPRGLPCLHTFCQDCLQSYINESFMKDSKQVACPICQKKITEPEPGLSHDKWARAFPLNYFLLTADDQKQSENSPAPAEECKVCLRSNKVTSATHYCKNCTEAICESCKDLHAVVRLLQNHDIMLLKEYIENPVGVQNGDEVCLTHAGKIVEVFCLDHMKMCCSICFATQHRHCKDVKSIDECIDDPSMDISVKDMTEELEGLATKLEKEISDNVKLADQITKSKMSASKKMSTLVDAAKKNIEILHDQFEAELGTKFFVDLGKIDNVRQILRGLRSSVLCDKHMLQTVERNGTKKQLFVSKEKVRSQLTGQIKLISDAALSKLVSSYEVDAKLVEDVCGLKSLSSLKQVVAKQPCITENLVRELTSCTDTCYGALAIPPSSLSRYWHREWQYKLPEKCCGAAFLNDTLAVITSNCSVLVFNEKGTVKFNCRIPDIKEKNKSRYDDISGMYYHEMMQTETLKPADICSTDVNNEIYISFCKKKFLKRYAISTSKLNKIGEIHLKGVAEGFFLVDDKIVHASTSHIYISSKTGDLIKTIAANTASKPCIGLTTWSHTSRTFTTLICQIR